MPSRTDHLLEQIAQFERQLELELDTTRAKWRYRVEGGRVRFEQDAREFHRRFKQGFLGFLRESNVLSIVTAPAIYSLIVPVALLDVWVSMYQTICFRAYGIARVKRSAYIVIDRQHLAYLNWIETLNCVYCGYATGVFAYVREIAGRTEQYWCPIRHAKRAHAPHPHYREFVDYGDAEGYRRRLIPLRNELKGESGLRDH
ncbi:MAG: hypothetical protein ACRD1V_04430 [Vicinamibacterales bacterium]